jgi:hypothetical protein
MSFAVLEFNLIMQPEAILHQQHPLRQVSSGTQSIQSQSEQFSSSTSGTNSNATDTPSVFDFESLEFHDETGDSR